MRIPIYRALLVMAAAAAAAGWSHVPVAAASAGANDATPLIVDMECPSSGGGVYTCQAYASGGSGTGYSITWSNSNGPVWETYEDDGYGEADAACYGGLGQGSTSTVTATATDSNSGTALKSRVINC